MIHMNPIIMISFSLSVIVLLSCIVISLWSQDDNRVAGAICIGFVALLLTVATGVNAARNWDKLHLYDTQIESIK